MFKFILFITTSVLGALAVFNNHNTGVPGTTPGNVESHVPEYIQTIRINLKDTRQTIHHFGASDAWSAEWVGRWPASSKAPIAKLLFSDGFDADGNPDGIALSMWRFHIGEGSAEQDDSGYNKNEGWKRETECFLNPDGTYDWEKQAGARWFLEQASAYGVPYFTGFANSPPYFMTKNGYTFRTKEVERYNLDPENYRRYAAYLATVAKHFENTTHPLTVVSPFNEPQWKWLDEVGKAKQSGSHATNQEIAAVTRLIDEEFSKQHVKANILIPEAAHVDDLTRYKDSNAGTTSDQIKSFFYKGSPHYVGDLAHMSGYVAAHSYDFNKVKSSIRYRRDVRDLVRNAEPRREFWQTEYSLLNSHYTEGRDVQTMAPIDYALWLARVIHTDLTEAECTGWSFWTALQSGTWGDSFYRFGLIQWLPNENSPRQSDGTFRVNKNLWALGNFSRFIRPGMVRIGVDNITVPSAELQAENVMVSAWLEKDTSKLVLVFINYSETEAEIAMGGDLSLKGPFTSYTTAADQDLHKGKMNTGEVKIAGKSIVTLVGHLK